MPTAFLYFPDRDALLKMILTEVDRYYRAIAREQHNSVLSPLQRIRNHVEIFSDPIDVVPDYAMVWLEWSTMFRNEYGLWGAFLDFQEFIISTLTRTIRERQRDASVPPAIVARDSARLLAAGAYALTQLEQMLPMALQPH